MVTALENRTELERLELEAFSKRLSGLLAQKSMSQSDLARALWGSVVDNRGRDVARNRDRISNYVRGHQMPEHKTIKRIAEVLGIEAADLVPALVRGEGLKTTPVELAMTVVAGSGPGSTTMAMVTVNKLMPVEVAAQIMAMLATVDRT